MCGHLPEGSITAIGAIIAALIAAAVSFVSLTLAKEQKTSEFRQAWIDALRQDLSTFFATVRTFARAAQELKSHDTKTPNAAPLAISQEMISNLRYQVAETMYRIQLRLNSKETTQIQLLRLMQEATKQQQCVLDGHGQTEQALKAIELAAEYAPQILKAEWERVKKGELAFRIVRNWIAPLIIFVSLFVLVAFVFLIVVCKLRI